VFVEDDYLTALNSIDALEEEGFEVVAVVQTGSDAIRAVQEEHPDLLVMDVRLNGSLDGVDAATEIFQRFGIRSVFATAHTDERTRARAALAHPLGWLAKPYSDTQLVQALNAALVQLN
jgi:CheY-like chemotaxis protein